MPEYDKKIIKEFADLMDELSLTEIEYGKADWHIRLSRAKSNDTPTIAPVVHNEPVKQKIAEMLDDKNIIRSPMLGVVYTAPDPDSEPYIQIGDYVTEDQTLFLIEAMKTFNPVKSPRAGKVVDILIQDRNAVEFDQPLLILE